MPSLEFPQGSPTDAIAGEMGGPLTSVFEDGADQLCSEARRIRDDAGDLQDDGVSLALA